MDRLKIVEKYVGIVVKFGIPSKQGEKAPVRGWCGFLCSEFSHRCVGLRQSSQGSDSPKPFKYGECR